MEENDKNNLYNQETIVDEKSLKLKIYNYFYLLIKEKKEFSLLALCILFMLEMIQLISYAFSEPHLNSWKISKKNMDTISTILGTLRISPLMKYVQYNIYKIIFFILIVFIFLFCIFNLMQILFGKNSSKLFLGCLSITRLSINPLTIFLYIPLTELILMQMKCVDGKIDIIANAEQCSTGMHYLFIVLSIIGAVLLFLCLLFLLTFYFSPFQYHSSTIKINSTNDIILLISKLVFIIRFIFIKDEYVSVIILLLFSLCILICEYSSNTYNNNTLETILSVRNACVSWTYLTLLFSKFFEKSKVDGLIYLLIFGYPIVIYLAIIHLKVQESDFFYVGDNLSNANEYLQKTQFMIKIIESFLDNNKNMRYGNELENQKNDILIRGIIKIHNQTCLNEECPLMKFMKNQGNYNIQKQCLLNYMSIHFNNGIRNFPFNCRIKIYFVQFNFSKRFNLNSVRTNLASLRKMKANANEEFIIFCLEQDIKKMENKSNEINENNETEFEVDLIDQKYRRLKFLIENSTKLYVEFWGIFAANITNNLNSTKLYSLGEKLNKYLNEIKTLWDNDLKGKKIDLEHQATVQLYSKFLKEILWDKKKSMDISKKINDEHHHHHETKKVGDENNQICNIDSVLDNQDFLIFANSNEKGKCNIVQCSNSITYLLGYQKSELIGKPIEVLMPTIAVEGHSKMLEERIKKMCLAQNNQKDSFRDSNKKQTFLLVKSKMGYLVPLNSKFTIYDDNDYSNTFIIKGKMESRDTKSVYAYYVLTRLDFTIESISSSALNLGLTMDLLKKDMIKIYKLIRTKNGEELNIYEKYHEYEDEPKTIEWVFPDLLFSKDDSKKAKNEDEQELIKRSDKRHFNLQINTIKYNEDTIIGYSFRFTELNKKKKNAMYPENFVPSAGHEILFDLLKLNYIRTVLVEKKTGLSNYRDKEENDDNELDKNNVTKDNEKRKKKIKDGDLENIQESSEDDENKKIEMVLTHEKIIELQTKEIGDVKGFIFSLPFFGNDVSLERHRPNKEKYTVGKTAEPFIKIQVSTFIKRMEDKIRTDPNMLKKMKQTSQQSNDIEAGNNEGGESSNNNYLSSSIPQQESSKNAEEINREISADTTTSLSKLFKEKSITYITVMSLSIFVAICFLASLEFGLTYIHINRIKTNLVYVDKGYKILNYLLYTKYLVTEAVIANELPSRINQSYYNLIFNNGDLVAFTNDIKKELAYYRQQISEEYATFSSSSIEFSDAYQDLMTQSTIPFLTKSGEEEITDEIQINSGMTKIQAAMFYISTITDQESNITLAERNTYELVYNLLNGYFIGWEMILFTLIDDAKASAAKSKISILILVISFVLAFVFLLIFWKLLIAFASSREKPITLILTIKKKIFENLKNSAENFSNKLLNKFFGNEDNEEESQQDYQANIQKNDVNIVKFKSPISSVNKDSSHLSYFLQLLLFFIVSEIYMVFKFTYSNINVQNISGFVDVYNNSQFVQVNTLLSINIAKNYFLNSSIPMFTFEYPLTSIPFFTIFLNTSDRLEDNLLSISKTECFLSGEYKDKFKKYFYGSFIDFIPEENIVPGLTENYVANGCKPLLLKTFDYLRFLSLQYLNDADDTSKFPANKTNYLINDKKWADLDYLTRKVIRQWFTGMMEIIVETLEDYINQANLIHITVFIVLIVLLSLYYSIFWTSYIEKLNSLLKKSRDLVNLIPEEIKYIIVAKLNE